MTAYEVRQPAAVGFEPDEIRLSEPTRSARLKWVIAVRSDLPGGQAVNAVACVAAAAGQAVTGLLGPAAVGPDGSRHVGLPWAGCTILAATAGELVELRSKAAAADGLFLSDMPTAAQHTRVYAEYLATIGTSADLEYCAVSLIGPRNRVDKLVRRLYLLP